MSIGNRHSVLPFTAGKSVAISGQRLAKVGYKSTKKNPAKYKSVYASIPMVDQPLSEEQLKKLNPFIIAMIENAQDGILKARYEESKGVLSSIGDEEISIEKCIEFLSLESEGGRLTVALIESWFMENLNEKLGEFLRDAAFGKFEGEKLEKAVSASLETYKEVFASLSGGKTHLAADKREKLQTILALSDEGDEIAERLNLRLENMAKKDEKIAADLGLISF